MEAENNEVREQLEAAVEIEIMLRDAVKQLNRSERGKAVKKQIKKLLQGPICSLDGDNWTAVMVLLTAYREGWHGSVLEVL